VTGVVGHEHDASGVRELSTSAAPGSRPRRVHGKQVPFVGGVTELAAADGLGPAAPA
jgi:hypothetical protein